MKRLNLVLLILLTCCSVFAQDRPYTKVDTYFRGTNYELNVYHIYGRRNGKTMLILGGIQGDEPGGLISADLYAGLRLDQGNLIVIPRANFKSVILYDRGPDGDMNRRFQEKTESMEMDKVVTVVKKLMGEADVFINLHDGWGYHNPQDIDANRNQKKFGQSVITDANSFTCANGRTIDLKGPATKVLEEINKKIDNDNYKLHYFDTNTSDPTTKFKDMRKTATYYALTHYCIPAFGVEASKNLPTEEMKVLYHNYAVNEFFKLYGIVPEMPSIFINKPVMQYAVVMVNDEPVRVDAGQTLTVRPGDVCEVVHIESNYDRGLTADLMGYGSLNDMNMKYAVRNNAVIQFRKDSVRMGSININVRSDAKLYAAKNAEPVSVSASAEKQTQPEPVQKAEPKAPEQPISEPTPTAPAKPAVAETKPATDNIYTFLLKHNGKIVSVAADTTYKVKTGDRLFFIAIYKGADNLDLPVNLKGYYSPSEPVNSGDDRGYIIKMLPSKFMKKYAEDDAKMTYPVIVKQGDSEIAKMRVMMK